MIREATIKSYIGRARSRHGLMFGDGKVNDAGALAHAAWDLCASHGEVAGDLAFQCWWV